MLTFQKTERGFLRADFKDRYGATCSIQESSLATEAAIWLGLNEGTHHQGECMARMHLTVEMAEQLIEALKVFVETGYLELAQQPPPAERGEGERG